MAIRGSLSEASLSDVVQLLAMGRKTGCLSLSSDEGFGYVYFEDGWISFASVVNRDLPADAAVYELFTWPAGAFNFEPNVHPDAAAVRVALDPQAVLLEAARRLDEWGVIEKRIPSFDIVFTLERQALLRTGNTFTPEEEALIPFIDGHRDVAMLVAEAGLGEFETGKAVYGLLMAGLLVPVGKRGGAHQPRLSRLEEHRNLGVAFYRAGMYEEALRELRRALELDPQDVIAVFFAGLVALHREEWLVGIAAMKRAAAQVPDAIAPLVNAAVAYQRLGRIEEARQALLLAAQRKGTDETLRINAAALAIQMGAISAARSQLAAVDTAAGQARSAAWYHYEAVVAVRERDLQRAAATLVAGADAHPRSAVLLNNLAAVRLAMGDAAGAKLAAERGLVEDSTLPQLKHNLQRANERFGAGGGDGRTGPRRTQTY